PSRAHPVSMQGPARPPPAAPSGRRCPCGGCARTTGRAAAPARTARRRNSTSHATGTRTWSQRYAARSAARAPPHLTVLLILVMILCNNRVFFGAATCGPISACERCTSIADRAGGVLPPVKPRSVATMSWCRSHAKLTSCVALLALALQLVLSFGHLHREDIAARTTRPAAAVLALAPASKATAPPAHPGYCATSAITALLAPAQHAEPPSPPPLQPQPASATLLVAAQSLLAEPRHLLAQARAP